MGSETGHRVIAVFRDIERGENFEPLGVHVAADGIADGVVHAGVSTPAEEGVIEMLHRFWRSRMPFDAGMIVIEDAKNAIRIEQGEHFEDDGGGIGDPLEGSGDGNDVISLVGCVVEDIHAVEAQIGDGLVTLLCQRDEFGTAIDTPNFAGRADEVCDVAGDGAGAATDVEDPLTFPEDLQEIGVGIPESPFVEDGSRACWHFGTLPGV